MKYFKKIEGERIYLSPMNLEDINKYVKWMNDFSVTDGLGSSSKLTTSLSELTWLENHLKSCEMQFAIILKETDEIIGNCGYFNINYLHQNGEVGLFIGEEENRNKGYGTEALKLIVDYGFNYLNLKNIMLKVYSFNEGAIKAYKKVGFKIIGKRTSNYYLNGKWYDEYFMEILRDE